jgi:hypothetical protein
MGEIGTDENFGDISKGLDISPSSQNLALSSKGLATISTNVTHWHANIVRVETTTPSLRKSTVEPLILSIIPLRLKSLKLPLL